jgi:hypothetical protein
MRLRHSFSALALILAACGGAHSIVGPPPPQPRKPDPWLTVRVQDQLDTTTAAGRTHWHIFTLLTGPTVTQNGVNFAGSIDLDDIRRGHAATCIIVDADSVGQRLIEVLAIGDTTTDQPTPDATAAAIANAYFAGVHTTPGGYAALTITPTDAWQSAQYIAGHGLVPGDPIKWGLDWTAGGVVNFYERTDTDSFCSVAI